MSNMDSRYRNVEVPGMCVVIAQVVSGPRRVFSSRCACYGNVLTDTSPLPLYFSAVDGFSATDFGRAPYRKYVERRLMRVLMRADCSSKNF